MTRSAETDKNKKKKRKEKRKKQKPLLPFKDPDNLLREDVLLAKESTDEALKLVDARMAMIEKIDKHPLSWPVATEYQKLKRSREEDTEDAKLFALAEKKVKEYKKIKNDEAKEKSARQKVVFQPRDPSRRFGKVSLSLSSQFPAALLVRVQHY